MTKKTETFIGPCSKWIDGIGWVTQIPIQLLKDKGYIKQKDESAEKDNSNE